MEEKEASAAKKAAKAPVVKTEKPTPSVKAEAKPKVAPKAEVKPKTEAKPKIAPKAEVKPKVAPKAEVKKTEVKPKAAPKAKVEAKPAAKPVAKVAPKAAPKAEIKPKAAAKPKAEVKPKAAPKTETKSKATPKVEAKPAAVKKAAPKADVKKTEAKSKVAPKEEIKPKVAPKTIKTEAKPAAAKETEPVAAVKKAEPKAEAKPKSEKPVAAKLKVGADTEAVDLEAAKKPVHKKPVAESEAPILESAQGEKIDGAEFKKPRTPGEHKKMLRPQKVYDYSSQASVPSTHEKPELLFPLTVKKHAKKPKKLKKVTGRNLRKTTVGIVTSNKMDKTIVVQIINTVKHPLYKKRIKQTQRFKAHDEKNECGIGDKVEIAETRKISRDKYWRLVTILEKAK
jgi:small subunit ribosomal protein S17